KKQPGSYERAANTASNSSTPPNPVLTLRTNPHLATDLGIKINLRKSKAATSDNTANAAVRELSPATWRFRSFSARGWHFHPRAKKDRNRKVAGLNSRTAALRY